MVMHSNLESFSGFQMESIIESFCIQQHTQAIGLSDLRPLTHIPIVRAKNLLPVGNIVQRALSRLAINIICILFSRKVAVLIQSGCQVTRFVKKAKVAIRVMTIGLRLIFLSSFVHFSAARWLLPEALCNKN